MRLCLLRTFCPAGAGRLSSGRPLANDCSGVAGPSGWVNQRPLTRKPSRSRTDLSRARFCGDMNLLVKGEHPDEVFHTYWLGTTLHLKTACPEWLLVPPIRILNRAE